MNVLKFLKLKKKVEEKSDSKQAQKEVKIIQEEPMVTMTREIMGMRYFLEDLKRAMHDDHHRILDEFGYLPKREDISDAFKEKIEKLRAEQVRIAKELEVTEFQKVILEGLIAPKSAQEVADELGKSRTWVSQQISPLVKAGFLEKEQVGKRITYRAIGAENSEIGVKTGENQANSGEKSSSESSPTENTPTKDISTGDTGPQGS